MSAIKFSKEERDAICRRIQLYFQEELEQESNDLYDDVLASTSKDDLKGSQTDPKVTPADPKVNRSFVRKYQLYIGNLTWWTTDQDIQDLVTEVGVKSSEFLEVKFFENRQNGQSKGFCCIFLSSESAMRIVIEKLPKKEIHGQV